jgi:hypothetical protein
VKEVVGFFGPVFSILVRCHRSWWQLEIRFVIKPIDLARFIGVDLNIELAIRKESKLTFLAREKRVDVGFFFNMTFLYRGRLRFPCVLVCLT